MTEKEQLTVEKYFDFIEKNEVSNEFLLQILRLSADFLNLTPVAQYEGK